MTALRKIFKNFQLLELSPKKPQKLPIYAIPSVANASDEPFMPFLPSPTPSMSHLCHSFCRQRHKWAIYAIPSVTNAFDEPFMPFLLSPTPSMNHFRTFSLNIANSISKNVIYSIIYIFSYFCKGLRSRKYKTFLLIISTSAIQRFSKNIFPLYNT